MLGRSEPGSPIVLPLAFWRGLTLTRLTNVYLRGSDECIRRIICRFVGCCTPYRPAGRRMFRSPFRSLSIIRRKIPHQFPERQLQVHGTVLPLDERQITS